MENQNPSAFTHHLPRDQRSPFSRKFYKRSRVATNTIVSLVAISCLLYDWDSYLGHGDHVFKGIRPAVRKGLDWLWGVEQPPRKPRTEEQRA